MKLINNFNSHTLLIGKSIVKNGENKELKYYTVINAEDAPFSITDFVANELFVNRGGKLMFIYVVKVIDQELMLTKPYEEKSIIKIDKFSQITTVKEDAIKLYIVQFMAYGKLGIEVMQATDFIQVKRQLELLLPKSYYIVNKITSIIIQTTK